MARMGRPPVPLKVLKARGSKWARGREETEPGLDLTGADVVLEPPDWLSDEERLIWTQVLDHIQPMGLLGRMDVNIVGRYCVLFGQWLKAKEFVEHHGQVISTKDSKGRISVRLLPQMRIFRDLNNALLQLEGELAMTPSARAGLGIDLQAQEGKSRALGKLTGKERFFQD